MRSPAAWVGLFGRHALTRRGSGPIHAPGTVARVGAPCGRLARWWGPSGPSTHPARWSPSRQPRDRPHPPRSGAGAPTGRVAHGRNRRGQPSTPPGAEPAPVAAPQGRPGRAAPRPTGTGPPPLAPGEAGRWPAAPGGEVSRWRWPGSGVMGAVGDGPGRWLGRWAGACGQPGSPVPGLGYPPDWGPRAAGSTSGVPGVRRGDHRARRPHGARTTPPTRQAARAWGPSPHHRAGCVDGARAATTVIDERMRSEATARRRAGVSRARVRRGRATGPGR